MCPRLGKAILATIADYYNTRTILTELWVCQLASIQCKYCTYNGTKSV